MPFTESLQQPFDLDDCLITAFNAARTGASKLLDACADLAKARWEGPPEDAGAPARDSEREIRRVLYEAFPDHPVFVGDGPSRQEAPELFWRAEPLDGAWAFLKGSPFFSVSLSLVGKGHDGDPSALLGVVLAPALMEMFWAVTGGGAFQWRQVPGVGRCEGPVSVSDCGRAEEAAARTSLGIAGPEGLAARRRVLDAVCGLTAEDSSSLSLAYVATGRAECHFQAGSDPWALAAGALLVTGAGGKVTGLTGERYRPGEGGGILASNGLLHGKFSELLSGG
ncbi:MAG: inositol monophosphatase [Deltaproteobacteria bacterium]|jgi:myo-inositol-1(or 4)-monophosphatase|nr:inositol monophosphatase [Deltaproteobacteria bacterium]